ncbi:hypothetical protein BT96DRAFT_1009210 [Gymnopus androsaceus JB14]|uniref:Endonuclease/exonuclease/phosphatase domain-containing protein n=1 Tax=Gymnopus androsaceus JB14 TaxID=1447944 RepID=A0A6A4GDG6_9AGAR|nr:hypothetical protein BT96DRAFT_1009210 [Gymnopus androsaceus JB14]
MVGDCNMVEEPMDRLPMRSNKAALVDALDDLKSTLQMEDRCLDRIYVRTQCSDNCFKWKIELSGLKTDHKMVSVRFTSKSAPLVGGGRWVMPTHLLYNKTLADFVNQEGMNLEDSFDILENEIEWDANKNKQTAWADFRGKFIALARKRAKVVVPKITRKINTLEALIDAISNDPTLPEDERSLTTDILKAKLSALEQRRHCSTRAMAKARNILYRDTGRNPVFYPHKRLSKIYYFSSYFSANFP